MSELPVNPNLPLGVIRNWEYSVQDVTLHFDDAIFLYTDGITEAENINHELFGIERLKKTLSGKKAAQAHLNNVKKAVADFVGEAPQSDDLTMLFFHYLNSSVKDGSEQTITLENNVNEIRKLEKFISDVAQKMQLTESLKTGLNLAMEEAVSNAIMYSGSKTVEVAAQTGKDEITFTITDSGKPFDPTAVPEADVNQEAAERPIGGLGIFLYRKIMDRVTYKRLNDKNILTLTKRLN